jgi:hypothetical protein
MAFTYPGAPSIYACLILFGLLWSSLVTANTTHSIDDATGLETWEWTDGASLFTLNQRVPDQARAFFQGRGFSAEQSEPMAQNCFFQIIIRNLADNDKKIALNLEQWQVIEKDGTTHPPRLEQAWQAQLQEMKVTKAAQIAFRWALFPSRQTFHAGDWNMGLITMGVAPGKPFDLLITWQDQDGPQKVRIDNMRCGEDRSL